jgi:hypothetical protein
MQPIHLSTWNRTTPTLKIERALATPGYYVITLGDYANNVSFMVPRDEFVLIADQWQYELHTAWRDAYESLDEADAHAADGTVMQLVHGADEGGKQ